ADAVACWPRAVPPDVALLRRSPCASLATLRPEAAACAPTVRPAGARDNGPSGRRAWQRACAPTAVRRRGSLPAAAIAVAVQDGRPATRTADVRRSAPVR